jgi:hypothetical protein
LADVQQRFSDIQKESIVKVQMTKEEMVRNEAQLAASNQTLSGLKLVIFYFLFIFLFYL